MLQASFKCETPRLELKSWRTFLAIKRWQRTKIKKVIKHLRSSKLRWAHICAHSRIPVNQWNGNDEEENDEDVNVMFEKFFSVEDLDF